MKVTQIEKLNQLISRTDMTGSQKVEWLTNFIDEYVTEQLRLNDVSESTLDKDLVEQRCKSVLEYLFPNYERQMTTKQYNNAMEALRSIAFGTPAGKNYR